MKDSEIVLRAAHLVANGQKYSCDAIGCGEDGQDYDGDGTLNLRTEYTKLFAPQQHVLIRHFWLAQENLKSHRKWRILALLFFAEMLKSEGR